MGAWRRCENWGVAVREGSGMVFRVSAAGGVGGVGLPCVRSERGGGDGEVTNSATSRRDRPASRWLRVGALLASGCGLWAGSGLA